MKNNSYLLVIKNIPGFKKMNKRSQGEISRKLINKKENSSNGREAKDFMRKTDNHLNIRNIEKLTHELNHLKIKLSPYSDETKLRRHMFFQLSEHVNSFLLNEYPDISKSLFITTTAFFLNDIFLSTSEIEIVLINELVEFENFNIKEKSKVESKNTDSLILENISKFLKNLDCVESESVIYVQKAKPITIKFVENEYGFKFSIRFGDRFFKRKTQYINEKIRAMPYLKTVYLLFSYYLSCRKIDNSFFGGLSQYSLFYWVLHFCMLHPLIQTGKISVIHNLAPVFMDFFQFYGCLFPYEKTRLVFNKYPEFRKKGNTYSIISIEDPVDRSVHGEEFTHPIDFKELFSHSYSIMNILMSTKVKPNESLLSVWMIYNMDEDLKRHYLMQKFIKK